MRAVWLACCAREEYPAVQREIEMRDRGARIVRCDDCGALQAALAAMEGPCAGMALYEHRAHDDEMLAGIGALVQMQKDLRVVALLDVLDPAWIAQLFHAGATEVVAAHEGIEMRRAEAARARVEGDQSQGAEGKSPLDGEPEPGARRATRGLACNATEAEHEAAPRALVGEGACWGAEVDDIDEPDATAGEPLPDAATHEAAVMPVGAVPGVQQQTDASAVASRAALEDRAPAEGGDVLEVAPAPATAAVPRAPEPQRYAGQAGGVQASCHRAPLICAVSGQGGAGTTTIIAAMACSAARLGLRTAVLDLDLMFGNLYELLGVEALKDLGSLGEGPAVGDLDEARIVRASMRIAPGLTLWGPIARPERAELMGAPVERLLAVLRAEADVILADTSRTWTDAVAGAVASCDRCLVVGDQAVGGPTAMERAVSMVARLGVPRTRMMCVVNRFGARVCTEEAALRLEMAASLSARVRIADGGAGTASLLSYGRAGEAARAQDAFGRSIRSATRSLLRELGCPVGVDGFDDAAEMEARPRLRLPWKRAGEGT